MASPASTSTPISSPAMSVLDNIYLGRQPTRGLGLVDTARQRREARALLDRYGIDLDLDALVATLPTVKQKEVEIAKALALDARVLLMDEPTGWLAAAEVAKPPRHHPHAQGQGRRHRLYQPHPRRDFRRLRHADDHAGRARSCIRARCRESTGRAVVKLMVGDRLANAVGCRGQLGAPAARQRRRQAELPGTRQARRLRRHRASTFMPARSFASPVSSVRNAPSFCTACSVRTGSTAAR